MVAISTVTWSPLGLILTHHLHRQIQGTQTPPHTVRDHCYPEFFLSLCSYLWEAVVTHSLPCWEELQWLHLMRLREHLGKPLRCQAEPDGDNEESPGAFWQLSISSVHCSNKLWTERCVYSPSLDKGRDLFWFWKLKDKFALKRLELLKRPTRIPEIIFAFVLYLLSVRMQTQRVWLMTVWQVSVSVFQIWWAHWITVVYAVALQAKSSIPAGDRNLFLWLWQDRHINEEN